MIVSAFRTEKKVILAARESAATRKVAFCGDLRSIEQGARWSFGVIEGFGHGWPRRENERVWEFLAGKRLPEASE
jgi:hypothetical protein